MKICIICPLWGYFGGREQYLIDVVEELTKRGHTCCVIYEELTNRPVTYETTLGVTKFNIPNLTEFESSLDSQYSKVLRSILDKEKPDVILANDLKNISFLSLLIDYGKLVTMTHYGWLFCLRNVRILYLSRNACHRKMNFRCLLHGCFLRKAGKASVLPLRYNSFKELRKLINLYLQIPKHIVASRYMKNLFLDHGFHNEQVEIINLFAELPGSHYEHTVSKDPRVVFMGRIDRYKGVDFLLKALSRISSPFTCDIIGDGPFLLHCIKLSHKLGLEKSVNFLGWLSRDNARQYLYKASVIVVPSIMPEAFGMVGIEAMAYRKPVVAFDNGGISDWLEDGKTGYLVPSKDTIALATKIDYLLRNVDHADQLGIIGLQTAETKFNRNIHFGRLISLFEEIARR